MIKNDKKEKDPSKVEQKELYFHSLFRSFLPTEIYYLTDHEGFFHHETLPSLILMKSVSFNITERIDYYYQHGLLYKKDGAAKIHTHFDNQSLKKNFISFFYHQKKELKKENQLLSSETFLANSSDFSIDNELIEHELYNLFVNSHIFSSSGPSIIKKITSSSETELRYENYGISHREDGPAYIRLDEKGNIIKSHWFIEGKKI